ncbi:phospholipid-translocating P-type ATPase [Microthyrium microscopicum]|uniref:Phospholipid-transporting ATPase n=1 Tax=Microthyrium microscopicum TaxID=703497 RepID=A0A6A6U5H8_9PEZI|nr:phospholipid-translocating P-type ATPase [Microthyrium microscopicum]
MVENKSPAELGGELRRRRMSTQNDGSEEAAAQSAPSQTASSNNATTTHGQNGPGDTTTGTNQASTHRRVSSTSAIDLPGSVPPLEPTSRTVRFSADVERELPSAGLRSPTNPTTSSNPAARSSRAQGLSVQIPPTSTDAVTNASDQRVLSPTRSAMKSPLSPNSRNRGYSLRSNLFRRNVETQGTVIELEEGIGSSNNREHNLSPRNTSKKPSDTLVAISQVSSSDPDSPPGGSKKNRKGLSNVSGVLPNYYTAWAQSRNEPNKMSRMIRSIKQGIKKTVLRIHDMPPTEDGRHIIVDATRKKSLTDERTGKPYVENWIRSTRYTVYTFVPRQLMAQFSKLANFYFLCVAVLQMIPELSTTGKYTTIVPLLFFVSISMGKEAYDDFRRYRLDKEENARETRVLHAYMPTEGSEAVQPGGYGLIHWASIKWRGLRVGDIIKIKRDEPVPADVVLLHAEGEKHIAYIETMALDGETNLKSKMTPAVIAKACGTEQQLAECRAEFVVEDPNLNLYGFEGRVNFNNQTAPLTNSEIIYRGSILRNTPEAIAMVIYSGEECKIRMNANKNPRTKAPALQYALNRVVAIVVAFVVCLAIFNSIAYEIWRRKKERKSWYINAAPVPFYQILSSFFIMFSTMIPLSLYVSMEIIKLAQMFLLNDIDMYDEKSNTPFEARTSTINEELGQITHIFSDKTGTLTDNEMRFRKISVAGTVWLHDIDLQGQSHSMLMHKKRSKGKKPRKSFMSDRRKSVASLERGESADDGITPATLHPPEEPRWKSSARPSKSQPERSTRELVQYMQRRPDALFTTKAKQLLLSIALCHTCLPERKEDGSFSFQASSPDELALVQAAQELGYLMINREHGTVTLRIQQGVDYTLPPVEEVYEVLDVVEFSSTRKRMTVVVQFPDDRICVMCKGADSVIMRRLKLSGIALQKSTEIEARANRRKSIEAQVALARRSTQIDLDRNPAIRRSLSIGGPRRSMSGASHPGRRAEVDNWLRNRERDVELVGEEEDEITAARFSAQLHRASLAFSDARSSMIEDDEFVLDDALANDDTAVIERCFQHINEFATEGLRTLLYGYRFIDRSEYASWKEVYLAATTSLVEREDKVEKAGEMIEYDFDLAGATAIEDKLQAGVPEAIDKLRRANIRMWMLTGDKRETAINIGHSCRLIKDYSMVIVLDKEIGEVEQHIAAGLLSLQQEHVAHSVIVVDGMTLAFITETPHVEHVFFELAMLADSVICCRAQPSQKAQLVKAIRKRVKKSITLAIGDGANDIAMIQEAHVGIGLTGKEGLEAARTSDYSIAQFRFLNKLLLVHGRWNYIRTCKYILGTLWKELLFFLTQAIYQRYNGYTGTSLYESWSLATFNTLFTSLPVLVMGIFEKDLAASTLLAVPELYTKGQRNQGFNLLVYAWWMLMAAVESMIIFFLMLGLFGTMSATKDPSLFAMGDLTFVACVILISMKMQLVETHNRSIIVFASVIISIGAVFLWNILLAIIYPKNSKTYHVSHSWFDGFGKNPLWWLTLILIVLCVAVFEYGIASLRVAWFPSDVHVFQELEKDPEIKKRFEEAAAMDLQQGWDRGKKKSSGEIKREREVADLISSRADGVAMR